MKYVVIGNYNGHMRHIIARCDSRIEAEDKGLQALRRDARRSTPGARLTVEVTKIVAKVTSPYTYKGSKNVTRT